ncbi:hypothetical protein SAMN06297422_11620 [Lachnospiraceae bacterium]|nr:hypothetical protein SAMN06297422_11620 [Lachnospiraceae bacterium]
MAEKIVQTAGRNQLGEFAPMFARLNDDLVGRRASYHGYI